MGFQNNRIVCDTTVQQAFKNDVNEEGIVNSIIIYNSLSTEEIVEVYLDELLISTIVCPPKGTTKFIDKLNIASEGTIGIKGNIGIIVMMSYIRQAVDMATAKTTAQNLVDEAQSISDGLTAQLPDGAISDDTVGTDTTYSSVKILDLMHNDEGLPVQDPLITMGKVLQSDGLKSEWVSSITLGVDCGGASNVNLSTFDAGSASSFN